MYITFNDFYTLMANVLCISMMIKLLLILHDTDAVKGNSMYDQR